MGHLGRRAEERGGEGRRRKEKGGEGRRRKERGGEGRRRDVWVPQHTNLSPSASLPKQVLPTLIPERTPVVETLKSR